MIIAIDGPAASGKGTLGRRLAEHYGYAHLDTGLLYRAVGHALVAAGKPPGDGEAALAVAASLDVAAMDPAVLRTQEIGEAASVVAAMPAVRTALLDLQRRFARAPRGAVLDGRDIGTVVCPDADVKIFVVASPEVRAARRFQEEASRDPAVAYETVLADIRRRDERDSGRAVAPLRPAQDAHLLDTTALDIEAAFRAAVDIVDGSRSTS